MAVVQCKEEDEAVSAEHSAGQRRREVDQLQEIAKREILGEVEGEDEEPVARRKFQLEPKQEQINHKHSS